MFWKLDRMFRIHQLHCNFHSDFVCEHLDDNPKSWEVKTIFLDDLSKSVDVGADCVSRANDVQGTTSPGWKRYLNQIFTPNINTKYLHQIWLVCLKLFCLKAKNVQGTTSPGWKRYLHFTPIIYTKYDLSTVLVGINKKQWKNCFALKQRTSKASKCGFSF